MPSFSYSSAVRIAADTSLMLQTTHLLFHTNQSDTVHNVHGTFPDDIDVLLSSDLVLSFAGSLDRVKVSNNDISKSAVVLHLQQYFQTNAAQLGLNAVSNIYVDENDGIPRLTLTSSRSVPRGSRPPHATLVSIEIFYKWRSKPRTNITRDLSINGQDSCANPFSSQLLLPFKSILDNVIEKFVSVHIVKRYPLIFGQWCKKLDIETPFFTPIARSILNMLERSPNDPFVKKCRRLTKTLKKQNRVAFHSSFTSLFTYLQTSIQDSSDDKDMQGYLHMTDEDALCMSLERLFKLSVPRSRFKGFNAAGTHMITDIDADDEFEFFDQKSAAFADEQDSSQDSDLPLLWDDIPLSPESGCSPFLVPQRDHDRMILHEHHIDEYLLDDEGEWTQDDEGGWVWRVLDHDIRFDFDDEDELRDPSIDSDLEEFGPDSTQDFILAPLRTQLQSSLSPSLLKTQDQGSWTSGKFSGADSDSHWNLQDKSQDGFELSFPNASARSSSPILDHMSSLILPSNEGAHNSIRSSHYTLSGSAYLENSTSCDKCFYSGSDSSSEVLHDFDNDMHATLSDFPAALFGDGIHEPNESFIEEGFTETCSGVEDSGEWDEEGGLLEFDMD